MKKFKLNSNKIVNKHLANTGLIMPELSHKEAIVRSVNFTPETKEKLEKLRAKYKLSKSAIIRILIDGAKL